MKTYYVGSIPVSDELYHYGRKGMKWGKDIFGDDKKYSPNRSFGGSSGGGGKTIPKGQSTTVYSGNNTYVHKGGLERIPSSNKEKSKNNFGGASGGGGKMSDLRKGTTIKTYINGTETVHTNNGVKRASSVERAADNIRKSVNKALEQGSKWANSALGTISEKTAKASEYVTGSEALKNYERQLLKDYVVYELNDSPSNKTKNDAAMIQKFASFYKTEAEKSRKSAEARPWYDVFGKSKDEKAAKGFEEAASDASKSADDLRKFSRQIDREYEERKKEERNKTYALKKEWEKTLPGSVYKTANNFGSSVSKAASNVGKSVSKAAKSTANFASKTAKDVSSWGGKQVDKGKKFFKKIFG